VKPVLLDTGVVVALLDRSERHHTQCARVVTNLGRPLVTCEAVIAESCYLLRRLSGAAEVVLENVARGVFLIPFQLSRSASQVRNVMRKYSDQPAHLADACLIHLADELNTGEILTLDRDFAHYRWRKTRSFDLLIDLG
jgi:predicted nucleic acid-binding protein